MNQLFYWQNWRLILKKLALNNLLPEQCYPLVGQVIIKDTKDDRIELIGRFYVDKYSDTIHCNYNLNDFYPKHSKLQKETKSFYISSDNYPQHHKYELVAKTSFQIDDVEINNVSIIGFAKIDPTFELSLNKNLHEFTVDLFPIYKDEYYCGMQVW